MNKNKTHQLKIKNKLIAAIAMLLVSSIMMVSTTYAWFTLSTAPEVQGITTTVGANGNLEIALAHPTGDNSWIGTAVGDANQGWVVKNLTWGNLLNLQDAGYSLDQLTLLPTRLNIIDGDGTRDTLHGSPLMIPVYGADGRISELDGNKMNYGAKDPSGNGFLVNPTVQYTLGGQTITVPNYKGYGVRALGTSSTQSETELNFQIALNAVNTYRGQAFNKANAAIGGEYGAALADMAVTHAGARGNDTNEYKPFVSKLQGMMGELSAASNYVEKALINALVAISNANIPYGGADKTIGDAEVPNADKTVREYLKDGESIGMSVIWENIPTDIKEELEEQFPTLVSAYNVWKATKTQVDTTTAQVNGLAALDSVLWTNVSPVLSGLMNLNNVTLNGMALDSLTKAELLKNVGNLNLELNDGSGVLANFGKLTGNLSTTVELTDDAMYEGESLGGVEINIMTKSVPAAGPLLTQVRATINSIGAVQGSDSTTALDVIYGYVLDFVFRTNAANSNLLLQTEGAQRIYGDSTNAATMGLGSTMTFGGKYSDLQSLVNMMSGIRVVFTNTVGDSTEVYGIAKVVFDDFELPVNFNTVTLESEAIVDAVAGTTTYQFKYTEGAASDAKVYMTTTDVNGKVNITLKTGDHQYIFVEEIEDESTDGKDYRWTVKTAMWYEKTTITTEEVDGQTVTTEVIEEVELKDALGNLIFYPEKNLDTQTGVITAFDETAKTDYLTALGIDLSADVNNTDPTAGTAQEAVIANWADPVYYAVHNDANANLEIAAPLYLHNYTITASGMLDFNDPMAVQTLTALDQNVITGVSALVYLDGDYVENSDVLNSENGISNSGTMNLQFASSANLVPMENTALKNGESYDVTINKPDGVTVVTSAEKASNGQAYTFALNSGNYTVTYKVGAEGTAQTLAGEEKSYQGQTGWVYTIPADEVTDVITIDIVAASPNP